MTWVTCKWHEPWANCILHLISIFCGISEDYILTVDKRMIISLETGQTYIITSNGYPHQVQNNNINIEVDSRMAMIVTILDIHLPMDAVVCHKPSVIRISLSACDNDTQTQDVKTMILMLKTFTIIFNLPISNNRRGVLFQIICKHIYLFLLLYLVMKLYCLNDEHQCWTVIY